MRRIVSESGVPLRLSFLENKAVQLARGFERAYFSYYQKHKRILPKDPTRCRYWKSLISTASKLLERGITDFELYAFAVIEEFHRRKGEHVPLYPQMVFSDTGIWYYEQSRKRMELPALPSIPSEKYDNYQGIEKKWSKSQIVSEFLKKRGLRE